MTQPAITDAMGLPFKSDPSNGNPLATVDPLVRQLLWPCYFSCLSAIIRASRAATPLLSPEQVAEEAMGYSLAAMKRIGFNFVEQPNPENPA